MGLLAGDLIRIDYRGLCYGQRIILTTSYEVTVPFDNVPTVFTDLAVILDQVAIGGALGVSEAYLACLQNAYTMTETRAQRIYPVRSAYRSVRYAADNAGSAGAGTVANDSAAITLRGANAGRKNVATKHIGPIPDSASALGLLTNAYKVILQAFIAKITIGINMVGTAGRLEPRILNKPLGQKQPIVNAIIGDQSRVQRRRTVGLGE